MEFNLGEEARRRPGTGNCSGCLEGKTYVIGRIDNRLFLINDEGKEQEGCDCWEDMELVKPMKTNYILVYDKSGCGDPVEYFETLLEVESRIQTLVKENGAVLDSIKVYEVKSVGVVKGIKIDIKFEK